VVEGVRSPVGEVPTALANVEEGEGGVEPESPILSMVDSGSVTLVTVGLSVADTPDSIDDASDVF